MNTKHSVILLSGLLLLMLGIAWAQGPHTPPPTCPALEDERLQEMLKPTAWARADWNAQTARWEIDCKQLDAIANMSFRLPMNATTNATTNTMRSVPANRRATPRRNRANVNR